MRWLLAALIAAAIGMSGAAHAQNYPVRTVTLIVPFPPGGGVDALARIVAEKLTIALKEGVLKAVTR